MLEKCSIKELDQNVFSLIGKQWMLITAGTPERCNTMTASWGGLGVLWGSDVATCYVRPQRYTFGFMEESGYFTLSFFSEDYRQQLTLCGTKSGRELEQEMRRILKRRNWYWSVKSFTRRILRRNASRSRA